MGHGEEGRFIFSGSAGERGFRFEAGDELGAPVDRDASPLGIRSTAFWTTAASKLTRDGVVAGVACELGQGWVTGVRNHLERFGDSAVFVGSYRSPVLMGHSRASAGAPMVYRTQVNSLDNMLDMGVPLWYQAPALPPFEVTAAGSERKEQTDGK